MSGTRTLPPPRGQPGTFLGQFCTWEPACGFLVHPVFREHGAHQAQSRALGWSREPGRSQLCPPGAYSRQGRRGQAAEDARRGPWGRGQSWAGVAASIGMLAHAQSAPLSGVIARL